MKALSAYEPPALHVIGSLGGLTLGNNEPSATFDIFACVSGTVQDVANNQDFNQRGPNPYAEEQIGEDCTVGSVGSA